MKPTQTSSPRGVSTKKKAGYSKQNQYNQYLFNLGGIAKERNKKKLNKKPRAVWCGLCVTETEEGDSTWHITHDHDPPALHGETNNKFKVASK